MLNGGGHASFAQRSTNRLGAAVLPDDGVVNRLARLAVPDHGGFALVGDADSTDIAGFESRFEQGFTRCGELGAPDLHRVVLNPARLGIDLGQLQLGRGDLLALGVKDNAAGAGSALIQGKQISHDCY